MIQYIEQNCDICNRNGHRFNKKLRINNKNKQKWIGIIKSINTNDRTKNRNAMYTIQMNKD